MRLEEPGLRLTRRQALTGFGGLGAAALLATGCTARNPATTAGTLLDVFVPGTLLWRARPPAGIDSLVATDSLVFVGVGNSSGTFGGVYAMHAGTGQKAWTQYGDISFSPYAVERGVLFGVGLDGVGALNAATGKVLWRAPVAGTVNLGLASTWVLVTDGTVCTTASQVGSSIAQTRNVVLGLDSGSGRRKWVADLPSLPTVLTGAGRLVFTGSPAPPFKGSGQVVALDAATGRRRWTSANLHMVPGQIAVTENVVVVSTSDRSTVPGRYLTVGLDSATGHELWQADGSADPLIAGGGLVFGVDKTLWARDARSGRQVWEHAFGKQEPLILAATGGNVLANSGQKVHALSAATGEELWSQALPTYPVLFTTAAGAVYVAAVSNPLAEDGGTNWIYAFQA